MRVVVQRVSSARLCVDGNEIADIGKGLVILVGIRSGDTEREADMLSKKCAGLRIFCDDNGKMNISAADVGAEMLVVSNFTLYGDMSRGYRPNFLNAARPEEARPLYEYFVNTLRQSGITVRTGIFGADMKVDICADGPVTLVIDTDELSRKKENAV